uniref:Helix-turn-helix protein n=1 Tax=Siphoviridae sp. ctvok7 TaxID=2827596 RepID=A0A8S5LLV8_9CAUD|nr:MAG TPA: helix-turn-helix protein [Siphoviridae sp. ctvok7]
MGKFPERLRKLREERKMKRYILSQVCGLHSDAIRRYERGESEPDLASIIAIANFFEVSLDYLVGRADYR